MLTENTAEALNYTNLVFNKLDELKKLTVNQRKTLIAGDIDIYLSLEKIRASVRKEISEMKNNVIFSRDEYKLYMINLNEMLNLEKDNQRIILEWKGKSEEEENKLRNVKRFATAYFNIKSMPSAPSLVNRVT
jgi:hypothetical protein